MLRAHPVTFPMFIVAKDGRGGDGGASEREEAMKTNPRRYMAR